MRVQKGRRIFSSSLRVRTRTTVGELGQNTKREGKEDSMKQEHLVQGKMADVYEDPITRLQFEGRATLARFLSADPAIELDDVGHYRLERWDVIFLRGELAVERTIRVDIELTERKGVTGKRLAIAEAMLDARIDKVEKQLAQVIDMRAKGEMVSVEYALTLSQSTTLLVVMVESVSRLRRELGGS